MNYVGANDGRLTYCARPLMQIARSFVIKPSSIVSTHTSSRAVLYLASATLSSSLARWARPRVHANIDAAENNAGKSMVFHNTLSKDSTIGSDLSLGYS